MQSLVTLNRLAFEGSSKRGGARVDQAPLPRLRVFQHHEPHAPKLRLALIGDAHRDDVVFAIRAAQRIQIALVQKVRYEEQHRPPRQDAPTELQRMGDVGRTAVSAPRALAQLREASRQRSGQAESPLARSDRRRLPAPREDLAHNPQGVLVALARRNELVHLAVKQQQADLVVVVDGRKRQQRREFHRRLALRTFGGTEIEGRAHVHDQENGELTLFDVALHVRRAHARSDVPVDGPDIVARNVWPDFVELDAAALEDRDIGARQDVRDLAAGSQLDPPDLVNDLRRQHVEPQSRCRVRPVLPSGHQGTSTLERITSTRSSALRPSASAS